MVQILFRKPAILTDAYYSFPGKLLLNAGFLLGIALPHPHPPASHRVHYAALCGWSLCNII